jgi:hypothetical protein
MRCVVNEANEANEPGDRERASRDLALKVIVMARESTQAMCERIQVRAAQLQTAGDAEAQELWRALLPELFEIKKVVDATVVALAFGAGGTGGTNLPGKD